jgi:hypothetical protein
LPRFRQPLAELAKEIAAHKLDTEENLLTAFFRAPLSLVEEQLITFAEQIGHPMKAINWRAASTALLLTALPTVIWILWALMTVSQKYCEGVP